MPLVETHQHQQVCEWVLAPAGVSHAVEARSIHCGVTRHGARLRRRVGDRDVFGASRATD